MSLPSRKIYTTNKSPPPLRLHLHAPPGHILTLNTHTKLPTQYLRWCVCVCMCVRERCQQLINYHTQRKWEIGGIVRFFIIVSYCAIVQTCALVNFRITKLPSSPVNCASNNSSPHLPKYRAQLFHLWALIGESPHCYSKPLPLMDWACVRSAGVIVSTSRRVSSQGVRVRHKGGINLVLAAPRRLYCSCLVYRLSVANKRRTKRNNLQKLRMQKWTLHILRNQSG